RQFVSGGLRPHRTQTADTLPEVWPYHPSETDCGNPHPIIRTGRKELAICFRKIGRYEGRQKLRAVKSFVSEEQRPEKVQGHNTHKQSDPDGPAKLTRPYETYDLRKSKCRGHKNGVIVKTLRERQRKSEHCRTHRRRKALVADQRQGNARNH